MLLGYARVSTADQHLNLQHDALTQAGCDQIFDDHGSGATADRAGLRRLLAYARWRHHCGVALGSVEPFTQGFDRAGHAPRQHGDWLDGRAEIY